MVSEVARHLSAQMENGPFARRFSVDCSTDVSGRLPEATHAGATTTVSHSATAETCGFPQ